MFSRLVSASLVLWAASASAWLIGGVARAPAAPLARRAAPLAMAAQKDPEDVKRSAAEFFDEAKDEEQELFDAELAKSSAAARSPEAVGARREAAAAIAAALRAEVDAAGGSHGASTVKRGGKASGKLAKALKKPKGTMALVGEGVQGDELHQMMGGYDLDDPVYLSSEFRNAGCAAVCARTHGEDALGPESIKKTVEEQETARGEFPSPLLVIARGEFVDEVQLAVAAADGAKAVVLDLALTDASRTEALMAEAADLGMESLVRATDAEMVKAAVDIGAKMVVFGDCTHPEATALLSGLPKGVVSVADVPSLDVRGVWAVRDMGFNALIYGKCMLEVCTRDRVPPSAIIKAALSKGSVKYGLGMQKGRLEGSKEFLGSLAM